jgi:hypothetical protein
MDWPLRLNVPCEVAACEAPGVGEKMSALER